MKIELSESNAYSVTPLDYGIALLIAVITFFLFHPFSNFDIVQYHDGDMFKPALDLLRGNTLYQDTFTLFGPLTILIHTLAVKIFGPKLTSLKLDTVIFYCIASSGLYLSWRNLLLRRYSLLGIFIWWNLAPIYFVNGNWGGKFFAWPAVHALAIQSFGMFFLLQGWKQKSKIFFVCSGVFIALSFWCRQNTGVALALGLFFFLGLNYFLNKSKQSLKSLILFFLGWFGTQLAVFTFLFSKGLLKLWFSQSILIFGGWYKSQNSGAKFDSSQITRLFQHIFLFEDGTSQWAWKYILVYLFLFSYLWLLQKTINKRRLLYFLCLLPAFIIFTLTIYSPSFGYQWFSILTLGFRICMRPLVLSSFIFSLYFLLKARKNIIPPFIVLSIFSMTALAELIPWNQDPHAFWALSPSIGLFLFWLSQFQFSEKIKNLKAIVFFLSFCCLTLIQLPQIRDRLDSIGKQYFQLSAPPALSGMLVPLSDVQTWEKVDAVITPYLKKQKNVPALVIGGEAIWATLANSPQNAGYYWSCVSFFSKSDWETKAVPMIKNHSPIVFLNFQDWPIGRERLLSEFHYHKVLDLSEAQTEIWVPLESESQNN